LLESVLRDYRQAAVGPRIPTAHRIIRFALVFLDREAGVSSRLRLCDPA